MNIASNQAYQKGDSHAAISLLVYPIGFEPTAPSVGGLCSIQLSYGYVFKPFYFTIFHPSLASVSMKDFKFY